MKQDNNTLQPSISTGHIMNQYESVRNSFSNAKRNKSYVDCSHPSSRNELSITINNNKKEELLFNEENQQDSDNDPNVAENHIKNNVTSISFSSRYCSTNENMANTKQEIMKYWRKIQDDGHNNTLRRTDVLDVTLRGYIIMSKYYINEEEGT